MTVPAISSSKLRPSAAANDSDALRVLVVEDEWLIAMEIVDTLSAGGHRAIGPTNGVAEARRLIGEHRPQVALLDTNLAGASSEPIAEMLAEDGVPFAVVSGYGALDLQSPLLQAAPRVDKPFTRRQILDMIDRLQASARMST